MNSTFYEKTPVRGRDEGLLDLNDPAEAQFGETEYLANDLKKKVPRSMLEARLAYAASGLFTFPAPRGAKKSLKSAAYSNGARWGMTRDPNEIRNDFARWPSANIGIVTGPESGIFVVEADTEKGHGVDGIAALAALGTLPPTRTAVSPSGSTHYYFRYPSGVVIKNSASVLAPGVDVRGAGGMVIAPPSVRDNGEYRWLNALTVANAPPWLLRLIVERPRPTRAAIHRPAVTTPAEYLLLALHQIDPDTDQVSWFQIACALRTELGDERGFEAWDRWSSAGRKYKSGEMRKRWEYLSNKEYQYSAGTIYHLAERADPGWRERADRENIAAIDRANREFSRAWRAASDEERDALMREFVS